MNRNLRRVIQHEERSTPQLQGLVHQLLQVLLPFCLQHAYHYLDIVLAKAIQSEGAVRRINLSVGANLGITVLCRPFGDIRMKPFPVPYNWCEQQKIAAPLQFGLQPASKLIPRLRLHRELAIRTILRPQPRKQQPQEMIDLGYGCHRAFPAASAGALLDRNGRRNSSDQIHVRPGKLLHELPRVRVHRIEEPALSLREQKIERQRAFTGPADARDHDITVPRDRQRDVLKVVLPRSMDTNGVPVWEWTVVANHLFVYPKISRNAIPCRRHSSLPYRRLSSLQELDPPTTSN